MYIINHLRETGSVSVTTTVRLIVPSRFGDPKLVFAVVFLNSNVSVPSSVPRSENVAAVLIVT